MGFPENSVGKESACNAVVDAGSILGSGRSAGEEKGYPLQYSGLENSMDCIVRGVTKSQTWLRDFHSFTFTLVKNWENQNMASQVLLSLFVKLISVWLWAWAPSGKTWWRVLETKSLSWNNKQRVVRRSLWAWWTPLSLTGMELMRAVSKQTLYKAAAAGCTVCLTGPFSKSITKPSSKEQFTLAVENL